MHRYRYMYIIYDYRLLELYIYRIPAASSSGRRHLNLFIQDSPVLSKQKSLNRHWKPPPSWSFATSLRKWSQTFQPTLQLARPSPQVIQRNKHLTNTSLPVDSDTILVVKCWPTSIIVPIHNILGLKPENYLYFPDITIKRVDWCTSPLEKCERLNLALTHKNNNCFDKARSTFQDGTRMDTWLATSQRWEAPAVLVGDFFRSLSKIRRIPVFLMDYWSVSLSQEWHG